MNQERKNLEEENKYGEADEIASAKKKKKKKY